MKISKSNSAIGYFTVFCARKLSDLACIAQNFKGLGLMGFSAFFNVFIFLKCNEDVETSPNKF